MNEKGHHTGKMSGSSSRSSKGGGGSYLSRQAKAKKVVTEEDLKRKDYISPEDVRALTCATKGLIMTLSRMVHSKNALN